MVLQEPFLFSRSIGENISITEETPHRERIRHAAEIACVDEAIEHFTDGYDTIVGERGVTLSGGQKQRVAIARTLMMKAPILVFLMIISFRGGCRDGCEDPPCFERRDGKGHGASDLSSLTNSLKTGRSHSGHGQGKDL